MGLARNALAFTLLAGGIPVVYQGQEQHLAGGDVPGCRKALWLSGYDTSAPLYKHIAYLNQIRNHTVVYRSVYLAAQTHVLNYTTDVIRPRKDIVRVMLTSKGDGDWSVQLTAIDMGFASGARVLYMLSCNKYQATYQGEVAAWVKGGGPVMLLEEWVLKGSGICGYQ